MKEYIRYGQCVRCGMCCTGFRDPCPHLIFDGEIATCTIHDRRDDPSLQGTSPANLLGCITMPESPQAMTHPSIFNKCGYYFVEVEKIMVACPTYEGKEYCFEEYLRAYEALDWPAKELFMVDTSETPEFFDRWQGRLRWARIDGRGKGPNGKIAAGMEFIRNWFLRSDCDRWFNLEADVIVPPETLKLLMSLDRGMKMDWISHDYPVRGDHQIPNEWMSGFGCTLFSRKIIEENSFEDAPEETTTDGWYWNSKIKMNSYKTIEAWWLLDIKHRGI